MPKLSNAVDVVLGIKEPRVQDVEELIARDPNAKRTWMMFSHTHKGQVCPFRDADLTRSPTTLDYLRPSFLRPKVRPSSTMSF